jgi:peptidylamidoglycolate lyase
MNRKKFLEQTSIVTLGLACMPSLLSAKQKEEIILGHNNKRYRIDTKWGALDFNRYPVKDCHEMVQDSKGRIILLTNETKNGVMDKIDAIF